MGAGRCGERAGGGPVGPGARGPARGDPARARRPVGGGVRGAAALLSFPQRSGAAATVVLSRGPCRAGPALRGLALLAQRRVRGHAARVRRSEEHTSELQSLMRISYAVFCLKKKTATNTTRPNYRITYHRAIHSHKYHAHQSYTK